MKFIYVITLYLLTLSGCIQDKVYPDKYDLDFTLKQGVDFKWVGSGTVDYNIASYAWDSSGGKNEEGAFCIYEHASPIGGDSTLDLDFEISQRITLHKEYKELKVGILRKIQNIDIARMKVTCLGQNEDILRKDTVNINGNQDWDELFLSIDLKSTYYIVISIYAHSFKNDDTNSRLSIDHVSLLVDGKNINNVNHSDRKEVELSPLKVIPLTIINDLLKIEMLSAKQNTIIGIGETFHGSSTMHRIAYQVVKNMVLHNNCKLILFEVQTAMALKWNLFINGYDIDQNELLEDLEESTMSKNELIELLNWLREYNANNSLQRVKLVGLDIRISSLKTTYLTHDYLFYLNKHNNTPILEELLNEYYIQKDGVYSFLKANQGELEKVMGVFEYKWLLNYFYIYQDISQIPGYIEHGLYNSRDYFMWLNFEYAVKLGLQSGEKAALYGHWGHINKLSVGNTTTLSLGYYINQHYGNKYKAIGLLGGEGQFTIGTSGNYPLNEPPIGSLEAAAMKLDIPLFFYSTSKLPFTPLLMRFNPQAFLWNQFIENSVKTRMDGVLFIRKCEGLPPSTPVSELKEMYIKRIDRMTERGDQLRDKRRNISL